MITARAGQLHPGELDFCACSGRLSLPPSVWIWISLLFDPAMHARDMESYARLLPGSSRSLCYLYLYLYLSSLSTQPARSHISRQSSGPAPNLD